MTSNKTPITNYKFVCPACGNETHICFYIAAYVGFPVASITQSAEDCLYTQTENAPSRYDLDDSTLQSYDYYGCALCRTEFATCSEELRSLIENNHLTIVTPKQERNKENA